MITAQRLVAAEIDYMLSLLRPMQAVFGEAGEIATASFGDAIALSMRVNADPAFNRVLGFGDRDLPLLDQVLDWFALQQVVCRFDIVSGAFNRSVREFLIGRGFTPQPLETFLHAASKPFAAPSSEGPKVWKLAPEEMEEFASIFLAIYPQYPLAEASVRTCLKVQYGQPAWHCYLASLEGNTAAFGAMYVNGGVASLISAATLPRFRRQGCQMALLARRMADAAELGCDLVWSHAACGSTSQRNMERQGMRPDYIKYRWERPAV